MSVKTSNEKVDEKEELDSKKEVLNWERKALEGEIEEGVHVLEVNAEEDIGPEERAVPGYTAPHSREDIVTVAGVYETGSLEEARRNLEEYLEENHSDDEFLGPEDYGITLRRKNGRVLSRACYIE